MVIRYTAVIALAACIAGCSGFSHSAGGLNPSMASQMDGGLLGTVTNANGIRDDVNAKLIEKYSSTPTILKAAIILARVEQDTLGMMESRVAPTQADFSRKNYAVACVGDATPSLQNMVATSKEILAMTYNTPERLRAYLEYNKKLDGFRLDLPRVTDPCESAR